MAVVKSDLALLDADGDAEISGEELQRFVDIQADVQARLMDADHDGRISAAEEKAADEHALISFEPKEALLPARSVQAVMATFRPTL